MNAPGFQWPLLLIAALAGCGKSGPPIAPATGSVALGSAPLTCGAVCFVSRNGFATSATLDGDGRFKLVSQYGDGIPLGEYAVTVVPVNSLPDAMDMRSPRPAPASPIPTRYQSPNRSGLTAVVTEAANEFFFRLSPGAH